MPVRDQKYFWPTIVALSVIAVSWGTHTSLQNPIVRFFAVIATTFGASILIFLPGFAVLAKYHGRYLQTSQNFALLLVGSGGAAWIEFWIWFVSPNTGKLFSVVLLGASVIVIAIYNPRVIRDNSELARPLLLGLLIATAYLGFAYSNGGIDGAYWQGGTLAGNTTIAMSYRFWLAPDNTLPMIFAQQIAAHASMHIPLLSDWQASDRPPLQTGFTLEILPLLGNLSLGYQLMSTVLQALWVPALWLLVRAIGFSNIRAFLVVSVTALTGPMFLNTIYVWPKMVAGAFLIASLTLVVQHKSLMLATMLAAFALLLHGGIAFAIVALIPIVWRTRPKLKTWIFAFLSAIAIYLPWMLFQRFADPPGNRLLKWMLAGIYAPDHNSFMHDLFTQYQSNWIHSLLLNKMFNILTLSGTPYFWNNMSSNPMWHGFFGVARVASVTALLWSSGPLILASFAIFHRTIRQALRPAKIVLIFTGASLFVWVALMFGNGESSSTLIHQGPYSLLILFVALLALASTMLPRRIAISLICLNAIWFIIDWIPGITFRTVQPGIATHPDWSMVTLSAMALAGIVWLAQNLLRTTESSNAVT